MHTPRNSGTGNGINRSSSSSSTSGTRASEMSLPRQDQEPLHVDTEYKDFSISTSLSTVDNVEVNSEGESDEDNGDTDTLRGADNQQPPTLRTAANIQTAHDDPDLISSPTSYTYTTTNNTNRSSGIFQRIKRRYTMPPTATATSAMSESTFPNRARSQTLNLEEKTSPYPPRSGKSRSLWSLVSISRSNSKRSNSSVGGIVAEMLDEEDRSFV